jgi:hypothetical protein
MKMCNLPHAAYDARRLAKFLPQEAILCPNWQIPSEIAGFLGWPTGFEPATARSTIWGSNQAELRPP